MRLEEALQVHNTEPAPLGGLPRLRTAEFLDWILGASSKGCRIASLFGRPEPKERTSLLAVLADDAGGRFWVAASEPLEKYASLTPECPQAHWFEREIAEQWGVVPEGHPWLKPIRFHVSGRQKHDAWNRAPGSLILPSVTDFFQVRGEQIHEVAVGPVHAGVIEPGHFRFQCYGENVLHLEISLGYQHRGVERALGAGPNQRSLHYAETLAGDTSVGHGLAYCEALEGLSGAQVPARAQVLRGVALELERLANHTGDLGALANDVGFLPTASYCGRLRGEWLNMTALLCGSRLGRGMIRPGGVGFDVDAARIATLKERIDGAMKDMANAVELLWNTSSVLARFEETGNVSAKTCEALGLVGLAARACGVERDARFDHPSGIFRMAQIPLSTWHTGDVFARAYVRWLEIQRSAAFIKEELGVLPEGGIRIKPAPPASEALVVSVTEGWRGEICHVALTDKDSKFRQYKIVDPSFHNWMGLAMSLRNQQISDFPLCNKSFNLSYCGHDL